MVKEQELECNIAAAELLGYEYLFHDKLACGSISIRVHSNTTRLFNLFTKPADCLAVVEKLGEKYIVGLDYYKFSEDDVATTLEDGWGWAENHGDYGRYETGFKTYEEAVGAACLEIKWCSNE